MYYVALINTGSRREKLVLFVLSLLQTCNA